MAPLGPQFKRQSRMDLKLKPFDFAQAAARAGLRPDGWPLNKPEDVQGAGFQGVLTQALRSVSQSQNEAQGLQREFQLGNPAVSLEQTMVAMQQAQIGFQAALSVRNRLVQAYTEIMNMQV
jgi:flagellar hook-basal body complex protein FliE